MAVRYENEIKNNKRKTIREVGTEAYNMRKDVPAFLCQRDFEGEFSEEFQYRNCRKMSINCMRQMG